MNKERLKHIIEMVMEINEHNYKDLTDIDKDDEYEHYLWAYIRLDPFSVELRMGGTGGQKTFVHEYEYKKTHTCEESEYDPGLLQAEEYLRGITEMMQEEKTA